MNIKIYLTALVLLLLASCTTSSSTGHADSDTTVVYKPEHATGFEILRAGDDSASVLINIFNPWQGASGVTQQLLIDRSKEGNLTAPTGAQVIRGDARRVVVMSSTAAAMLDAIDAGDVVVGASSRDFLSSPSVVARLDSIKEVGYEANVDYEAILATRPGLVILYGLAGPSPMVKKLELMGIPYIYLGDYVEQSPLGKSEWMVLMGELVGKRDNAEALFSQIVPAYRSLVKLVKDSVKTRKKVMFNTPYGDAWYMPGRASYQIKLIEDAGGEYDFANANADASSSVIDAETAFVLASTADVWLNTGAHKSLDELKAALPKMAGLDIIKEGRVYNNNLRLNAAGGNDYYESGAIRPDLVLRDLIKIMHPSLVADTLYYYRKL